jgi:coproporphyrinogen III oxidase
MQSRTKQAEFFRATQDSICKKLTELQGHSYHQDLWEREGGGGGDTRVYAEAEFLEKGGVNFSQVHGQFTEEFASKIPYGSGLDFYATGVSLVLHPKNPFVPTVHANFRYIQRGDAGWFGGGADLTPCFVFEEDAIHFHQTFFEALNPFGENLYPEFKKHCDDYFYLPHRKETRGIGGIFFDYVQENGHNVFEMVQSCANSFLKSYIPIVEKRQSTPFNEHHKRFQEYRRGRYVEFNLLYDRGTTFGLKTNGRVESILMSLPLKARWDYNFQIDPNTWEQDLIKHLKPTNWLKLDK